MLTDDRSIARLARELDLPKKFRSLRPTQEDALIRSILELQAGDKKLVLAELPTGTGKTLVGVLLQKLLGVRVRYLCTTISLQEQVMRDFPDAVTMKGRRNFPCKLMIDDFPMVTAEDCPAEPGEDGPQCDSECAYRQAKRLAIGAPLAVLNTSYFLNEVNHVGEFGDNQLLIIDEYDTIEDALKSFIEVPITSNDRRLLEMEEPEFKTKWESWKDWCETAFPKASEIAGELKKLSQQHYRDRGAVDAQLSKDSVRWFRLASKVGALLNHLDDTWVVEHDEKWSRFTFKPTIVAPFAKQALFQHADRVFGMSGYLNFKQELSNVGAKVKESVFIQEPSLFPAENRPIYGLPGVDLSYKNKDRNWGKLMQYLRRVLDHHKGENGLIHCISYDVQGRIAEELSADYPELLFHGSADRKEVINRFKNSGGVLVSPSVERGEDFPHDVCRFIIIVKLPYPYLGDPQVNRRLYGARDGRSWYTGKTVASLIQMAGRGVRASDDECVTYVLAADFKSFYMKHRRLFPKWIRDAVKFVKKFELESTSKEVSVG